jgi:hypothetical protein
MFLANRIISSALVCDVQLPVLNVGYHYAPSSLILHEQLNLCTENIRVIKLDLQVVTYTVLQYTAALKVLDTTRQIAGLLGFITT